MDYPEETTLIGKTNSINIKAEIRDKEKLSKIKWQLIIPIIVGGIILLGEFFFFVNYNNPTDLIIIMEIGLIIISAIAFIILVIFIFVKANKGYNDTWITTEFEFEARDGHLFYNGQQMFVNYDEDNKKIYVHNMDNHKKPYKATFYATIKEEDIYSFFEYMKVNFVRLDKEYLPRLQGKYGCLAPLSMSRYRR